MDVLLIHAMKGKEGICLADGDKNEKHILVTGFEPFGGETVNPAWECALRMEGPLFGYTVHALKIPTVFSEAARAVLEEAALLRPEFIFMLGQAGGREYVTPEKYARNFLSARLPDNAGIRPEDGPVLPGFPEILETPVAAETLAEELSLGGLPLRLSENAGSFVCNETYYRILLALMDTQTQALFIHVPFLPEQAPEGKPSLPIEKTAETVRLLIVSTVANASSETRL